MEIAENVVSGLAKCCGLVMAVLSPTDSPDLVGELVERVARGYISHLAPPDTVDAIIRLLVDGWLCGHSYTNKNKLCGRCHSELSRELDETEQERVGEYRGQESNAVPAFTTRRGTKARYCAIKKEQKLAEKVAGGNSVGHSDLRKDRRRSKVDNSQMLRPRLGKKKPAEKVAGGKGGAGLIRSKRVKVEHADHKVYSVVDDKIDTPGEGNKDAFDEIFGRSFQEWDACHGLDSESLDELEAVSFGSSGSLPRSYLQLDDAAPVEPQGKEGIGLYENKVASDELHAESFEEWDACDDFEDESLTEDRGNPGAALGKEEIHSAGEASDYGVSLERQTSIDVLEAKSFVPLPCLQPDDAVRVEPVRMDIGQYEMKVSSDDKLHTESFNACHDSHSCQEQFNTREPASPNPGAAGEASDHDVVRLELQNFNQHELEAESFGSLSCLPLPCLQLHDAARVKPVSMDIGKHEHKVASDDKLCMDIGQYENKVWSCSRMTEFKLAQVASDDKLHGQSFEGWDGSHTSQEQFHSREPDPGAAGEASDHDVVRLELQSSNQQKLKAESFGSLSSLLLPCLQLDDAARVKPVSMDIGQYENKVAADDKLHAQSFEEWDDFGTHSSDELEAESSKEEFNTRGNSEPISPNPGAAIAKVETNSAGEASDSAASLDIGPALVNSRDDRIEEVVLGSRRLPPDRRVAEVTLSLGPQKVRIVLGEGHRSLHDDGVFMPEEVVAADSHRKVNTVSHAQALTVFEARANTVEADAMQTACQNVRRMVVDHLPVGLVVMAGYTIFCGLTNAPVWFGELQSTCGAAVPSASSVWFNAWSYYACIGTGCTTFEVGMIIAEFLVYLAIKVRTVERPIAVVGACAAFGYLGKRAVNLMGGNGGRWWLVWLLITLLHTAALFFVSLFKNRGAQVAFVGSVTVGLPALAGWLAFPRANLFRFGEAGMDLVSLAFKYL